MDGQANRFDPTPAAAHAMPDRPQLSIRFAGITLSNWAFAVRVWIATVLSLYVAFWLKLQNAYSAAVCTAILSLPTRGQAFDKAFYRTSGTLIGVLAALVLAGLFNESRSSFIVGFAVWMAACGYVSTFLDGDRAYGAVLSGFTAAIVAFSTIDTPHTTFLIGMDRCAVILVGVVVVMIVNDLIGAPDVFPQFLPKLEATHQRIVDLAWRIVSLAHVESAEFGDIVKAVAAFRADIALLAAESIRGRQRAAAARTAVAALARQVAAMRMVRALLEETASFADRHALADQLAQVLRSGDRIPTFDHTGVQLRNIIALQAVQSFRGQDLRICTSFAVMRAGVHPGAGPNIPRFTPQRAAVRNALRLFIAMTGAAAILISTGWPQVSTALVMLAAIAAISVTVPNAAIFARNTIIAMLLAIALAGITEFIILDGADSFPILALGLAPAIIGASLLVVSGHPAFAPVGSLTLVFLPLILLTSNPANYDPRVFLDSATLNIVSVILLFLVATVILPTDDDRKRRWIDQSLSHDFRSALNGVRFARGLDETSFRDLDREAQLIALPQHRTDCGGSDVSILRRVEFASAAWRVRFALAALDPDQEREGRFALTERDAASLMSVAAQIFTAGHGDPRAAEAAATLAWMARLVERCPIELASFDKEIAQ